MARRAGRLVALLAVPALLQSTLAAATLAPEPSGMPRLRLDDGRTYRLHVPPQGGAAPRPLVVALPGADHDAPWLERNTGLNDDADRAGLMVAYGDGVDERWNAGDCCATSPLDDVAYLRELVAEVAERVRVDLSRVYVVGFSNGGMMAWRAVCEAPDVFAAAGVVAGALLVPCPVRVRVFHVHGVRDGTVRLTGGRGFKGHVFPDSRTEPRRVGAGSTVVQRWWSGGHAWPSWATGVMLRWLARWSNPPPLGPDRIRPGRLSPGSGPVR
jgi:poly(3-hydroxybutyrate) depolymerase